jgi:hypothetical protein
MRKVIALGVVAQIEALVTALPADARFDTLVATANSGVRLSLQTLTAALADCRKIVWLRPPNFPIFYYP